jgi:hypothetical protein
LDQLVDENPIENNNQQPIVNTTAEGILSNGSKLTKQSDVK